MALLFVDSFDHYVTADLLEKWTTVGGTNGSATISPTTGRRGSGAFRVNTSGLSSADQRYVTRVLSPGDATATLGFALNPASLAFVGTAGVAIASIRDGTSPQITLRLSAAGILSVVRGSSSGTVLGPASSAIAVGAFTFVELKVKIDPTVGTVDLRLNGLPVLSLTSQNTRSTANSSWSAVYLFQPEVVSSTFNSANVNIDYDDLYVGDGTGAAPHNGFLGDVRIDALRPTGAGASTGWTPSAGANWDAVNDAAPDDDATYVTAAAAGLTDTYVVQDLPVAAAPLGVQVCLSAKKTDAGACTIAPVVVGVAGPAQAPGTAYAYLRQVYPTNPATGLAWTEAGFNAAEFGVTRVT